jgi:meiotically up-regulated gene 157 (Mug157) protein
MDDANVPSLLSLPFLGYIPKNNTVYRNTRAMLLSDSNPFYFKGASGEGIGGPHQGFGMIWPMSIMVRAFTSDSDDEIRRCLDLLVTSAAAGKGFMHESFSARNATTFTRPWFAWANGLFGELILKIAKERPHLVFG